MVHINEMSQFQFDSYQSRLEIAKALQAKCAPTGISFISAFHTIQYELRWAAVTRSCGKLPALLKKLRQRLVDLPDAKQPDRMCDRVVKAKPARYVVRFMNKALI